MARSGTFCISASICEGDSRKEGGENLSNFSESSLTAASPRASMSFSVCSTTTRTLASSSERSDSGLPRLR